MPQLSDPDLEQFRSYLLLMAQLHWKKKLQGHYDPADLIQQTLMEAHEKRDQFQGTTEAELAGWLRTILAHNIADALRRLSTAGRDVNLEQDLAKDMESSSARLEAWLVADHSSPSQRAAKNEQVAFLATTLDQLLPLQRQAVIRHHLQGISLADLAEEMNRTQAAVAGLLRRGLNKLRELMKGHE